MLATYFKPLFESVFVTPIAKIFRNFQPEVITYFSCITGILVAPFLSLNLPFFATIFLLFSGFLDSLDGTVARINAKSSKIGYALDVISGRIVEVSVLIGLFLVDPMNRVAGTLLIFSSCYLYLTVYFIVGMLNHSGKFLHLCPGLMERMEAFFFLLLLIWMPNYYNSIAVVFSGFILLTAFFHYKQFAKYIY